jgi:hypothetical protein
MAAFSANEQHSAIERRKVFSFEPGILPSNVEVELLLKTLDRMLFLVEVFSFLFAQTVGASDWKVSF